MSAGSGSLGENIAARRKAAGLTQRQLAARANLSASLLQKIELGVRPALINHVTSIAEALRCPVAELTGQAEMPERQQYGSEINHIRRVVMLYDSPPDATVPPQSLEDLARSVGALNRSRLDGNLRRMAKDVGPVLEELTRAKDLYTGSQRQQALELLVPALTAADQVVYRLGYEDLSNLIGNNIRRAAREADSPHLIALSKWMHAGSYMITPPGLYDPAFAVLEEAFSLIDGLGERGERELALLGSLHLKTALVASHANMSHVVDEHLGHAREIAAHTGEVPHFQLAFGPVNTQLYEVATRVEMGMGAEAVKHAQNVVLPRSVPRERGAHHFIDTARGFVLRGASGDPAKALESLRKARDLAPQQFKAHSSVKETLRVLLHTRGSDLLTQLAREAGVADTSI